MKSQYRKAIKRIERLSAQWEEIFGPTICSIEHRFLEAFKEDDDPGSIADTQTYWQYRNAVMRWFLPAVVRLSTQELWTVVCHEHVHVLLCSMESHIKDKFAEQCEFAVENVTIAMMNACKVLSLE